jgi:hypothetical protein
VESRTGAKEILERSLNVRSRGSKRRRFGFSTSEDAVTWVVFSYLLRSHRLLETVRMAKWLVLRDSPTMPTLNLWGAPVDDGSGGSQIQQQLKGLCHSIGENRSSFSEPDAIIDLGPAGLVFVEVKYRSGNDCKPPDYVGWERYASAPGLDWCFEDVKASGCYELARNWFLLKSLAADRPATLVNLGPTKLFEGPEGARLIRFAQTLGSDAHASFKKAAWPDLLRPVMTDAPGWFSTFCFERGLMED